MVELSLNLIAWADFGFFSNSKVIFGLLSHDILFYMQIMTLRQISDVCKN